MVYISDWITDEWIEHLTTGSDEQRFQHCLIFMGNILYMRAILGHSGGNRVDPVLQDNVEILHGCFEHSCHVGSTFSLVHY